MLRRAKPSQLGFNLVELMVTIAVLAIMAGLAVPSFVSVINSNRLTSSANELLTTLQLARSEAVRRNVRVTVCASADGSSCAAAWTSGWIAFADTDRDAAVDVGETIVRAYGNDEPVSVLASSDVGSSVSFRSDGLARTSNGTLLAGRIAVCSTQINVDNVRDVVIAAGSRVSVSRRDAAGVCASPGN